jgi:hypothetical protein
MKLSFSCGAYILLHARDVGIAGTKMLVLKNVGDIEKILPNVGVV